MGGGPVRSPSIRLLLQAGVFLATILISAYMVGAQSSDQSQSASQDQSQPKDKRANSDKSSAPDKSDKDNKSSEPPTVKLNIVVTGSTGKPVAQASVYVRFNESGGLFHKDKLAELDLKTDQEGKVKVPEIPQGKILIQIVAKGWHTYGKWFDFEKPEETVPIQLEPPPHWY